ncbi:hypothetical protein GALMADRAFT_1035667 [Galerina marginata CBS 339.88]|uniref:Uncharacterized protein n=1 Tax=Galerina marginata (strain CBS 339.88) TaxID=685588 RepID=A0A067SP68_GALM3|nr:hypothetical protein GALMADRAFT_1035667 [Galerina marginata CBS 339.88]
MERILQGHQHHIRPSLTVIASVSLVRIFISSTAGDFSLQMSNSEHELSLKETSV